MSVVSAAGGTEFRKSSTATNLPALVAGEEFISIPTPDDALEIQGVDVFYGGCWCPLDAVSFAVRRDLPRAPAEGGQWALLSAPLENAASTPAAGAIAIFPSNLTGQYKIWYTRSWIPVDIVTNPTFLWVTRPDWITWVVNDCVIQILQRDNSDKSGILNLAVMRKAEAEKKIISQSSRVRRAGPIIPRRSDGWSL